MISINKSVEDSNIDMLGDKNNHESVFSTHEDKEAHPDELADDDQHPQRSKNQPGNLSFQGVIYTMINTAVGGSIFGYPYIFRQFGIIMGFIMIILGGFVTCYSSSILQKVKNLTLRSSYPSLADAAFGKIGRRLASIVIVINASESCITYLLVFMIATDNMMQSFLPSCSCATPAFYCQTHMIGILAAVIILPFNFKKSFHKLKMISMLKVLSILLFTGVTVAFGIYRLAIGKQGPNVSLYPNYHEPVHFVATFPQVLLGYNFLYNQFTIYKTMQEPSDAKLEKGVKIAMGFAGFVCLSVGFFGYMTYGDLTQNIMKNFNKEDLGEACYIVVNLSFIAVSLCGIPITFFQIRTIMYNAIIRRVKQRERRRQGQYIGANDRQDLGSSQLSGEEEDRRSKKYKLIFKAIVVGMTAFITLIAVAFQDLNQILGLIGSVGINSINLLFPMLFYLKLSTKKGKYKVLPVLVLVLGICIGLGGLVTNLIKVTLTYFV